MRKIEDYNLEENEFISEDISQHPSGEAFKEAIRVVEVAAGYCPGVASNQEFVLSMIREILHWLFAKPGTHDTPSNLLKEAIREAYLESYVSTDAAPGVNKTND